MFSYLEDQILLNPSNEVCPINTGLHRVISIIICGCIKRNFCGRTDKYQNLKHRGPTIKSCKSMLTFMISSYSWPSRHHHDTCLQHICTRPAENIQK